MRKAAPETVVGFGRRPSIKARKVVAEGKQSQNERKDVIFEFGYLDRPRNKAEYAVTRNKHKF